MIEMPRVDSVLAQLSGEPPSALGTEETMEPTSLPQIPQTHPEPPASVAVSDHGIEGPDAHTKYARALAALDPADRHILEEIFSEGWDLEEAQTAPIQTPVQHLPSAAAKGSSSSPDAGADAGGGGPHSDACDVDGPAAATAADQPPPASSPSSSPPTLPKPGPSSTIQVQAQDTSTSASVPALPHGGASHDAAGANAAETADSAGHITAVISLPKQPQADPLLQYRGEVLWSPAGKAGWIQLLVSEC